MRFWTQGRWAFLLAAAGCVGVVSEMPMGAVDGGSLDDAGVVDAGAFDAGTPVDAGAVDAGEVDAGPVDAGPVDAGPIDAGFVCHASFCEDFEGQPFDGGRWRLTEGYDQQNRVSVERAMVSGGLQSARSHVNNTGGGFAWFTETSTFPALADGLWGRARFFTSIAETSGHSDFIAIHTATDGLEIGISQKHWQLTWYPAGGGEHPVGYNTEVPIGRWVCLEWHFQRNADPLIEVFVDGTSLATYGYQAQNLGPFTDLRLGFGNHSATDPANDAYYDDLAIDAARVGCQ